MNRSYLILLVLLGALVLAMAFAPAALAYTDVAAYYQSGGTGSLANSKIAAVDDFAVKVENGGVLTVTDSWLESSTKDVRLGDAGGTVTVKSGSKVTLTNTKVYSHGLPGPPGPPSPDQKLGAQGVFVTGVGSAVTLNNCYVECDENSARGLYGMDHATIIANNCTVVTHKGGGGAAVATSNDNGGTVILNGGTFTTYNGMGSAVFYSTGSFFVNNAVGYAALAEGMCIDGGYFAVMSNSSLTAAGNHGVSFAKGPLNGIANDNPSVLEMTGGSLSAAQDLFYAPNSKAIIWLTKAQVHTGNGIVVGTVKAGGPPENPARESYVLLLAEGTELGGDIVTNVDPATNKPDVVWAFLTSGSVLAGKVNAANAGIVNLSLDASSTWVVTGTSYVNALTTPHYSGLQSYFPLARIASNGFKVYYNADASPDLHDQVWSLPGGGLLVPYWATVGPLQFLGLMD